jgi:hypothetical protein
MSKYPGNPWWHHENDVPIAILDEFAWNEAAAGGHLTAEHILQRLENILEFEFGRGAEMGLAADGFYNALVADGWRLEGGVTVRLHPNDHPPPHVHLEFRSDPRLDLRLSIETGELLDVAPAGWAKRIKAAAAQVLDLQSTLMERWSEVQASVQPSA